MTTTDGAIKAFINNPQIQQRLAKHIALRCFRNSLLEDLHAGKVPDSQTGDFSDVVVKTPYGEIPWKEISRFNDDEMKALMLDVTNRVYRLVQDLFDADRGGELIIQLAKKDPAPTWEDPK
ncbi:MAG: hypothetical protein WBI20_01425 [Burkholderiaceae bacterium]